MKKLSILLMVAILTFGLSSLVLADGTETLGDPSIPIASGSGLLVAGTGMETQPGTFTFDVPAPVVQVILYWEGQSIDPFPTDDAVVVNSNSVKGTLIGGPTDYGYKPWRTQTYRADITGLGLVSQGTNTLTISGMDFNFANDGAGVLVIYDDGVNTAEIGVRDGNDFAFINFASPLDSTVPQTFNFAAASYDRTANLALMVGSIDDDRNNVQTDRPSTIEVTVDGTVTYFRNELASVDGRLWDAFNRNITIPAGATSLTVQIFSRDDLSTGLLPASLVWIGAGISIVPPPPPPGGEGCTPGGWQGGNGAFRWDELPDPDWDPANANPFDHDTFFNSFFTPWGSLDGLTMLDLVGKGGGKDNARKAARSLVAAYLNASHADVAYPLTTTELESLWDDAVAGNITFLDLHTQLDEFNNLGCSLD